MYPSIASLYAVFTNMRLGFFDLDLVQMRALLGHSFLRKKKISISGQVTTVT
jgi:hypothetical protein